MSKEFLYKKLRPCKYDGYDVIGFFVQPSGVLAGQTLKQYIDTYPDEASAKAAHPEIIGYSHPLIDPVVSFSHLPGENDPVPGGMYPDDTWAEQ